VAIEDIINLSKFGIGIANNGGGSDGEEFTLPSVSLLAGENILVITSSSSSNIQNYLGPCFDAFDTVFVTSGGSLSGDDAVELFENGEVIETFGNINVDGKVNSSPSLPPPLLAMPIPNLLKLIISSIATRCIASP
jgi:hypothetical protein